MRPHDERADRKRLRGARFRAALTGAMLFTSSGRRLAHHLTPGLRPGKVAGRRLFDDDEALRATADEMIIFARPSRPRRLGAWKRPIRRALRREPFRRRQGRGDDERAK